MWEKEELILNFMKDINYVPMKAKEMALMLSVPKTEYPILFKILPTAIPAGLAYIETFTELNTIIKLIKE